MYFTHDVTLNDYLFEGSCESVGGKYLHFFKTLIRFVTIGVVILDIKCF